MLLILNGQAIVIYKIKFEKNSYSTDEKHLKLNSILDTRLAHNTLGNSK